LAAKCNLCFLGVLFRPIPVAALFKVWVCDRSLAGIAGLNPAGGIVNVVCYQIEVSAKGRFLVQRSLIECVFFVSLSVIRCNSNRLQGRKGLTEKGREKEEERIERRKEKKGGKREKKKARKEGRKKEKRKKVRKKKKERKG